MISAKLHFTKAEVETAAKIWAGVSAGASTTVPTPSSGALRDMKKFVLETDYQIYETAQVQKDYEIESEYFGIVGLQRGALATLNVAMGTLGPETCCGTAHLPDKPGCHRKLIPVYGSGGWLSYSDGELVEKSSITRSVRIYSREDQGSEARRWSGISETAPGARGGGPGLKDHDGRQPGDGRRSRSS